VVQQPDSTYPIVINPSKILLDEGGTVKEDGSEFTIANISDEDLEIQVVYKPHGYFDIDIPGAIKSGKTAKCRIKAADDFLEKSFEKSITFELNDTAKSRFTLPISQRIKIVRTKSSTDANKPSGKSGGEH
jgi:hypothetical protein